MDNPRTTGSNTENRGASASLGDQLLDAYGTKDRPAPGQRMVTRRGVTNGGIFIPTICSVAVALAIGIVVSSLGWRASNADLRTEVEIRSRLVAEKDAAVARMGEAVADATKLEAELKGILASFIGSTEANLAEGNMAECAKLIAGLDDLWDRGAPTSNDIEKRFGITREQFTTRLFRLIGFDHTDVDELRSIIAMLESGD